MGRRLARPARRDECRVCRVYPDKPDKALLGEAGTPPRWRAGRHGTTRRRHNSAARLRTYAALDAPRPHCRSRRRDGHRRSASPVPRAGLRVRGASRQSRPAPSRIDSRTPRPPAHRGDVACRRTESRLRALRGPRQGPLARRHRQPRHPGAVPRHRHGARRHRPACARRGRQRLGRRHPRRSRARRRRGRRPTATRGSWPLAPRSARTQAARPPGPIRARPTVEADGTVERRPPRPPR